MVEALFERILSKLDSIESLLKSIVNDDANGNGERTDRKMDAAGAAEYLGISRSTLYKKTSRAELPCHRPGGKILHFFRSELDAYIRGEDLSGDRMKTEAATRAMSGKSARTGTRNSS